VPRTDGARLGRLATSDADVNIKLLTRLAETAITSGDIKTAIYAVRACTAEAENLYRIAAAERSAAAAERSAATAAMRVAAEQNARAIAMQEATVAQQARAVAAQEAATAQATAQLARAAMIRDEAVAQHARAMGMRNTAEQALADAAAQRADLEAQRLRDQRKRAVPRQFRISDPHGMDMRPDPSGAGTPVEYIEALRLFQTWAGNPSYRELARRCEQIQRPVAHSTIYKLLHGGELPPRFEVIEAIITVCGGTEEDKQRFMTAWRRFVMPERKGLGFLRAVPDVAATPPA
jgi:hypothetical protein